MHFLMRARPVRDALVAFLLSRAILFLLLVVGSQTAFVGKVYNDRIWETRIVLESARVVPGIILTVMNGDTWWYRSIAVGGYERRPFSPQPVANWAFFPLYPLTVRALHVSGDYAIDGMLVSNAALLGALWLLAQLTLAAGGTEEDAARATFFLAFFPTSYFLSWPLPESLFLLVTVAAFYAAMRDRWWMAGAFGALAAATRAAGIFLLPALLLLAIERGVLRRAWAWLLVIPAGTAAFMLHLYRVTGNALAFAGVQGSWGHHPTPFWTPLVAYLRNPNVIGEPWNLIGMNALAALLLFGTAVWWLVRRRWAFGTYALLSVLFPLSAGSLQSMTRYAAVVFPLFIALAFAGRRPAVERAIAAISMVLFGWLVALATLRLDFALA
jgi:hypothetical protein